MTEIHNGVKVKERTTTTTSASTSCTSPHHRPRRAVTKICLDKQFMSDRFTMLMNQSEQSQRSLQIWDEQHGLPKSHSQTMVNSSRSRKQLQDGVILPKWDGSPLIQQEQEHATIKSEINLYDM